MEKKMGKTQISKKKILKFFQWGSKISDLRVRVFFDYII
jgi:hypothetical protein